MIDLFGYALLLAPFAFFWCCCGNVCFSVWTDGTPAQLQLTVADTVYSFSPFGLCPEIECDERAGVRLLDLLSDAAADAAYIQFPNLSSATRPPGMLIYTSEPFTTCYVGSDSEEFPQVNEEMQWAIYIASECSVFVYLYVVSDPLDNFDLWQADLTAVPPDDPIVCDYNITSFQIGFGCDVDESSTVTVEVPP